MIKVYISASTQAHNVGVGNYGTEQDRMMELADKVAAYLSLQGVFKVYRNKPNWSLVATVNDCNASGCALFIDNHTNAGPRESVVDGKGAEGTEVYYNGPGGTSSNSYRAASLLYKEVAPISLGGDRGIKSDSSISASGLYVVRKTNCPAVLIEHIFHTNAAEVKDYIKRVDEFARAEAKAVCDYFGVEFKLSAKNDSVKELCIALIDLGIVTDANYWYKALTGAIPLRAEYVQIAFARSLKLIK